MLLSSQSGQASAGTGRFTQRLPFAQLLSTQTRENGSAGVTEPQVSLVSVLNALADWLSL